MLIERERIINPQHTHTNRHKCKGKLDRRHPWTAVMWYPVGGYLAVTRPSSMQTSMWMVLPRLYVYGWWTLLSATWISIRLEGRTMPPELTDILPRQSHRHIFQFPLIKGHSYRVFVILGVSVLLLLPCHTPNGNDDPWQSSNRLSELDSKHFTRRPYKQREWYAQ